MMHRVPREPGRGKPCSDLPVQRGDGAGVCRAHQLVAEDLPKQGVEGEPGFAQPGYLAIELECAQAVRSARETRLATTDRRQCFQERHIESRSTSDARRSNRDGGEKPGQHFVAEIVEQKLLLLFAGCLVGRTPSLAPGCTQ